MIKNYLLICKRGVRLNLTLPENSKNIIASKYQLYLPTEQQLIAEVKKEIEKLDNDQAIWKN